MAVLDEIKLTVPPLLSDKATELRRFLLLDAHFEYPKEGACQRRFGSATYFRFGVQRVCQSYARAPPQFFRSDFGQRSIKELQRQLIV